MKKLLTVVMILIAAALLYAHLVLPAQIENALNATVPHEPYTISAEAQALHDSLFVADLHSDALLWKRNLLRESDRGHSDLPRLARGNVALQVFSATTKSPSGQNYESNEAGGPDRITQLAVAQFWPPSTWFSLYSRAAYQLDKLYRFADDSNLAVIRSRPDFAALVASRERGEPTIGGIYLIEGGHPLEGDIDNLDRLYAEGLRIVGLTHFFDNELGGSLHGISGDGLSEFGEAVVLRAAELGIIIDIAHASPQMVEDVLELSDRPVILSHGGMKGVCNTARNLEDELMEEVAAAGGLIGIGFWDAAVCDSSPAGVVASIRYAIDLLGPRNVALGSDYDGATAVLFDAGELAALTQAMLDADFSEEEIRLVMGDNIKRFLLDNLPGDGGIPVAGQPSTGDRIQ